MALVVIDASVVMAWALPRQSTGASESIKTASHRWIASVILRVEMRNALLKAERRGLLASSEADEVLNSYAMLPVHVPLRSSLDDVYRLGRLETVSFFDACYLDLALQETAALASRDGALIAAARRRGVDVEDLR